MNSNGILSNTIDITVVILRFLLNENPHHKSESLREGHYVRIRSTCRLWRDIADSTFRFHTDTLAFLRAVRSGSPRATLFMLSRSHPPEEILCYAAQEGNADVVRVLLNDKRIDPTAYDQWPINIAASKGHTEVVRLLLSDSRVNPSCEEHIALLSAVRGGHPEIVRLLLQDERVNPSVNNNRALQLAAETGNREIVQILLSDPRVDPTALDNLAILRAVELGHNQIVDLLMSDKRVLLHRQPQILMEIMGGLISIAR
ncbi:putative ankyrin [Planoprotostelium fungivorum]|uniref:Putative ankyrin n=1 Tax=Planoprotostelium fungivorum TaxID=1890364 RepID=A0A2P6NG49_9EUKA|nr:putative ankyrin [Planoprotostelium fungivorum]